MRRSAAWLVTLLVSRVAHAAVPPSTLTEPNASAVAASPNANGTNPRTPTLTPAPEQRAEPAPLLVSLSPEQLEIRNRLLRVYVHEHVRRANLTEGFGYSVAVISAFGLVVGATAWNADRGLAAAWTTGFGASTLVFGASLFASRDTRVDVFQPLMDFDTGVAFLGGAVGDNPSSWPRISTASASGAFFVLAIMDTVNALAHDSKLSTLRRERDRLDAGDGSAAELRTTEHDFLATNVPFGSGLRATPLGIGGAMALVPAFAKGYTKQEQTFAVITGSLLGLDSVVTALIPNLVPRYKTTLNEAGFSLLASPANAGFRYRF